MKKLILIKLVFTVLFLVGWVMNIVKFTQCDFEPVNKTEIVRGVCIFVAPVGAVIGYMDIGEENDR